MTVTGPFQDLTQRADGLLNSLGRDRRTMADGDSLDNLRYPCRRGHTTEPPTMLPATGQWYIDTHPILVSGPPASHPTGQWFNVLSSHCTGQWFSVLPFRRSVAYRSLTPPVSGPPFSHPAGQWPTVLSSRRSVAYRSLIPPVSVLPFSYPTGQRPTVPVSQRSTAPKLPTRLELCAA